METYTLAKAFFKELEGFTVSEIMGGRALDIVLQKDGIVASRTISKHALRLLAFDSVTYFGMIADDLNKELHNFQKGVR